jgi:hypothetical protein
MMPGMIEKYSTLIFVGIPLALLVFSLISNGVRSAKAAQDQFLKDGERVIGKVVRYSDGTFTGSEMHWIEFEFVPNGSNETVRTKAYFSQSVSQSIFRSWDRKRHPVGADIALVYLNGHPKFAKPAENFTLFA